MFEWEIKKKKKILTLKILVVNPPNPITVTKTITRVVERITVPFSEESLASKAKEKAIAPLNPANHIINLGKGEGEGEGEGGKKIRKGKKRRGKKKGRGGKREKKKRKKKNLKLDDSKEQDDQFSLC